MILKKKDGLFFLIKGKLYSKNIKLTQTRKIPRQISFKDCGTIISGLLYQVEWHSWVSFSGWATASIMYLIFRERSNFLKFSLISFLSFFFSLSYSIPGKPFTVTDRRDRLLCVGEVPDDRENALVQAEIFGSAATRNHQCVVVA